jgi:hypothetical protein
MTNQNVSTLQESSHKQPMVDVEVHPRGECRGYGNDLSTLDSLYWI